MDSLKIIIMQVGMLETNCYIISDRDAGNGRCIIIDPGDEARKICLRLEEEKLVPEAVLLTHGHFDHIGAIEGIKEKYPDIKIYADKAEDRLLRDPSLNASDLIRHLMTVEADRLLDDGEEFTVAGITFKNISTPGHTSGSACFMHEESNRLFCGDTLFECSVGRTDMPTGDHDVLERSLAKLMELPGDITCFPGHGRPTTIANERKTNPFITGTI